MALGAVTLLAYSGVWAAGKGNPKVFQHQTSKGKTVTYLADPSVSTQTLDHDKTQKIIDSGQCQAKLEQIVKGAKDVPVCLVKGAAGVVGHTVVSIGKGGKSLLKGLGEASAKLGETVVAVTKVTGQKVEELAKGVGQAGVLVFESGKFVLVNGVAGRLGIIGEGVVGTVGGIVDTVGGALAALFQKDQGQQLERGVNKIGDNTLGAVARLFVDWEDPFEEAHHVGKLNHTQRLQKNNILAGLCGKKNQNEGNQEQPKQEPGNPKQQNWKAQKQG